MHGHYADMAWCCLLWPFNVESFRGWRSPPYTCRCSLERAAWPRLPPPSNASAMTRTAHSTRWQHVVWVCSAQHQHHTKHKKRFFLYPSKVDDVSHMVKLNLDKVICFNHECTSLIPGNHIKVKLRHWSMFCVYFFWSTNWIRFARQNSFYM